ncbi:MAG: AAA family ATPase [Planctomycetota bacterium]
MTSGISILLVTQEDSTAKTIKSALDESEQMTLIGVCRDVPELRSRLSSAKVQAVVVDIDPDPPRVLSEVGMILTAYPETYVVVICSSFTKELVLQAMQKGARHFLEKKTMAAELCKELQVLVRGDEKKAAGSGSVVVSVFSAGGGCGATTVAVNLASELQLMSPGAILVIDLDNCYGTVSAYLGMKSQYGIADVLARKGLIDKHLIQSSAFNYKEDFHVLASPASVESPKSRLLSLQYENLPRALEACRRVYKYTVIDAPRLPGDTAAELANLSDVTLVVFQLTVKDVSFARSMVSSLTRSGVASRKMMLVANRVKKRGPLVRLEDSKKAVGLNSCQAIRNDWLKAMKSVNKAQPLAEAAGRSGLRNDFRKLAAIIRAYEINSSGKIRG